MTQRVMYARMYAIHLCDWCGAQTLSGSTLKSRDRGHTCKACLQRRIRQRSKQRQRPEQTAAHKAVRHAIRRGELVDLRTTEVPCFDCGKRAAQYDHRSYSRPLDVQPVCVPCNQKRGPAT